MNIAKWLCALAGLVFSAAAGAVVWDTDNYDFSAASGSIWCNQSGTCNTTGLTGSGVIKVTAYSTATVNTSGSSSPTDTGTWIAAQIAMYSGGGFGVSNTPQGATETGSPQHAIDNRGLTDIIVIDFNPNNVANQDNWDVSSFAMGWTCVMASSSDNDNTVGTGTTNICGSSGGSVNADAWLGGNGVVTFAGNAQFSGTNVSVPTETFTALNLSPDASGPNVLHNNIAPTDNVLGRYLVISASLTGYTDAFKIKEISATLMPPGGSTPVPGSLPLLALGLLALAWVSRRRPAAVRAR